MSYQVLARKWRPRTFRELVGQQHVLQALVNALDHDRLHHAYLFTGTRGVGKTTIARILAKCLNCETGVSSEPCGQCSACKEINEGRFIDLIEVDAASRTKVEDTRELLENVQYAPSRGRFKVYLIDEVHMLSSHSFNALLKTLEEPPPHVKFLLATTDPQKLPVTILSRCLQFHLKNMDPERIVGHLKHVLEQEMVPFDEASLWHLARAADGSMRDAMSVTDQAIAFGGGKVADAEVRSMLGTIDQNLVYQVLTALVTADGAQILQAVDQLSQHAPDYSAALAELLSCLHRIAIAQALPEAVDNSLGDRDKVMQLAQQLPAEDVQLFYQTALLGRRDLPMSPDARAGFEMVLLRMLAFRPQGVHSVPTQPLQATPELRPASNQADAGLQSEVPPAKKSETVVALESDSSVTESSANSAEAATVSSGTPAAGQQSSALQQSSELQQPPQLQQSPQMQSQEVQQEQDLSPAGSDLEPALDLSPLASDPVDPALQNGGRGRGLSASDMAALGLAPARTIQPKKEGAASPSLQPNKESGVVEPSCIATNPDASEGAISTDETEIEPQPLATAPEKLELDSFHPSKWLQLYTLLGVGGVLQSTVSNCQLVKIEGRCFHFTLDHRNSTLFDIGHQQRLSDLLTTYFGEPVEAQIEVGDVKSETPAAFAIRTKRERYQAALQSLQDDPVVQELLRQFDGVLDEESVKPVD